MHGLVLFYVLKYFRVEWHIVFFMIYVFLPNNVLYFCAQCDQNQAIAMVSYYASSSEPAQVRGKTVYIQYSNRQEIVNNKSMGDIASNVLLVTIEGVEAGDVSIDVLHLVSFRLYNFLSWSYPSIY